NGDDREEEEGREIGWVGDREGVERRQKEEVIAKRSCHARNQRGPKPITDSNPDDNGDKDKIDIFDAEPRFNELADADRRGDCDKRDNVGPKIEGLGPFGGAHRLFRDGLLFKPLAGNDMEADIAAGAQEIAYDGAMKELEPARPRGLADDNLRDVIGVRIGNHIIGDATVPTWNGNRLSAKRLCEPERVGDAVPLLLGQLQAALALDIKRGPRGM